jgi:formylglycine-generating enzyme required for sulfatase activity
LQREYLLALSGPRGDPVVSVQNQEANLIEHGNPEARDVLHGLEVKFEDATRTRSAALARALELLHRSHVLASDLPQVSAALSEYFVHRMLEAEREGDQARAEAAAAQARVFDDGRHARILEGRCRIELSETSGPGIIQRIVTGRDRCDESDSQEIPLRANEGVDLLTGRYLLTDSQGNRRAIRLDRGALNRLDIPKAQQPPPGTVFVPSGTLYGPDGRALRDVPAFAIGRTELTCGEYLTFLNDPGIRRRMDEAFTNGDLIFVPRSGPTATEPLWRSRGILGRSSGTFLLELQDGSPIDPLQPVSGISFEDALAFVNWRSETDTVKWRLPSRDEWIFAVQGGDGRRHPWGMNQDPGLCYSHIAAQRQQGVRNLLPVASFPRDCSVQGVYDLAGSLSEFILDTAADPSFAVLAGGNRADRQADRFTAWSRREILRRLPSPNCGFRLAADISLE